MRAGERLWQGQLSAPALCWRGGVWLVGCNGSTQHPERPCALSCGQCSHQRPLCSARGLLSPGQSAVTQVDAPALSCPSPPTMKRHLEQAVSKQEVS